MSVPFFDFRGYKSRCSAELRRDLVELEKLINRLCRLDTRRAKYRLKTAEQKRERIQQVLAARSTRSYQAYLRERGYA